MLKVQWIEIWLGQVRRRAVGVLADANLLAQTSRHDVPHKPRAEVPRWLIRFLGALSLLARIHWRLAAESRRVYPNCHTDFFQIFNRKCLWTNDLQRFFEPTYWC
jgi:hypothetical protein